MNQKTKKMEGLTEKWKRLSPNADSLGVKNMRVLSVTSGPG